MAPVIDIKNVVVRRGKAVLLDEINWTVDETERWVIIGPNGAGKSTLVSLASSTLFPTSGTVSILGETLGQVDVFELRPRIGISSALLSQRVPNQEKVRDVVVSASYGMVGRWQEAYDELDFDRAEDLMARMQVSQLASRLFGSLSTGEQKRVLVARSLMADPELLFLDEPASGLDLSGREMLVSALSDLCLDTYAPAMILVTHHLEDIPEGITHAMLIKKGRIIAAGPIDQVLNDQQLSVCFDMSLHVSRTGQRWSAFAAD